MFDNRFKQKILKWKWLFCLKRQNSVFPLFGLGFGLELGSGVKSTRKLYSSKSFVTDEKTT